MLINIFYFIFMNNLWVLIIFIREPLDSMANDPKTMFPN
jgi:hypothetical protein